MKTYSRKKVDESVEFEEIIDLDDVCRLCMEKEDELISIFNNEEVVPLTLRIMACVALEVFEGDGLPDKICHPCKFQLEKSYNFRKKCEQSDMKLRIHLKELKEKLGNIIEDDEFNRDSQGDRSDEDELEIVHDSMDKETEESTEKVASTEEDIVGVAKVSYIEGPEEPENTPNEITLAADTEGSKEACTLKTSATLKVETEQLDNDDDNVSSSDQPMDDIYDSNIGAIADAVKATLANQPGINVAGQLQIKVNPSSGKTTQVEVTTDDGHVIVMEISTEDQVDDRNSNSENLKRDSVLTEINDEGELKVFKCEYCPLSFSRRIALKRHSSVHSQQRGFSCGICEKWFPTKSALIRHERIHTGERPFQCEICTKSFAQKEILFRHMMTHSGQKPYNCPQCPSGFNQKVHLRSHMRKHAESDPHDMQLHYCSLCPKVFCHASGLSRHLLTHTGKLFKCTDCPKTFTDKSSLRRHRLQNGPRCGS
ncbi:zinc finger protein 813-like [Anthonomus grandis grandis]|uniref:zinc finger protein 813-like n=1 Tax=Anthonomus grandis grandis TaxID=2921223 RepID=UPI0021656FEE|nr:zinc finger protein 813-like [Anthonomus grandis grandis]